MKLYSKKWRGLDRGHEGYWVPSVWFAALKAVSQDETCHYLNPLSPVYQRLQKIAPDVTWVSTEANGDKRSLFRDAREPWTSLGVLSFNEATDVVSVTDLGCAALSGKTDYGQILIATMREFREESDYPFRTLAEAFLSLGAAHAISLEDVLSIMFHYRNGDNLGEALSAPPHSVSAVEERRIRAMLMLMVYAGGLTVVQRRYFVASSDVLKQIAGIAPKHQIDVVGGAPGDMENAGIECKDILAAIRTKPFVLLAGISGTGKSRMVRQLARGCCPEGSELWDEQRPGNFEMVQVRPNWHDSTELLGYVTRVTGDGKPQYVLTDFVRFLAKAWLYPEIPFFLCLDEMNLAPVEQYFAEYLSVVETRRRDAHGEVRTDPLVRLDDEIRKETLKQLYGENKYRAATDLVDRFEAERGIPIPPNLVVMGTVNMDETTFSFSRKVLDRAMSFELCEVDLDAGLAKNNEVAPASIPQEAVAQRLVSGQEAFKENAETCERVKAFLSRVNGALEGTPFKTAYRTRDEVMIYCIERMRPGNVPLAQALDEAASMKILSRVEGDRQREATLKALGEAIRAGLDEAGDGDGQFMVCSRKIEEMQRQLRNGGYTSFWTR